MKRIKSILKGNQGVAVIEIVLILVVLIALVLIFKTQLNTLIQTIFSKIRSSANSI